MRIPLVGSNLSSNIVAYLRREGQTLREIAELLDVSESYISRVARGERDFTVTHLDQLERIKGRSLPLILLEASRDQVPAAHKPAFEEVLALLQRSTELKRELDGQTQDTNGTRTPVRKPGPQRRALRRKAARSR